MSIPAAITAVIGIGRVIRVTITIISSFIINILIPGFLKISSFPLYFKISNNNEFNPNYYIMLVT